MPHPDNLDDATLEYAAQIVERFSFRDIGGTFAKRKRDREDADLRMKTRQELRTEIAEHLRAMMNRQDLRAVNVLRSIAAAKECQHVMLLRDAWPLAWKGWLNIEAILSCNSNSIPPSSEYRITLTDKGRAVLATPDAESP